MWEVLAGLIAGGFLVTNTWLGVRLQRRVRRVEGHAAAVRYQVQNDHSTNLRVEQDERHSEVLAEQREVVARLDSLVDVTAGLGRDVKGLRSNEGRLWDMANENRQRINDIERRELNAARADKESSNDRGQA